LSIRGEGAEMKPKPKPKPKPKKILAFFDGEKWYIRRVKYNYHDIDKDEKIYICDKPLANDLLSVDAMYAELVIMGFK
jgi:hypothetical protein